MKKLLTLIAVLMLCLTACEPDDICLEAPLDTKPYIENVLLLKNACHQNEIQKNFDFLK